MSYLIAIEGQDGVGKNTQAKMLVERLNAEGQPAVLFSFPEYETETGQKIKDYLMNKPDMNPIDAGMLYAENRLEARHRIMSARQDGKIVVCDRWIESNMAYQGARAQIMGGRHYAHLVTAALYAVETQIYKLPDAMLTIAYSMSEGARIEQERNRRQVQDQHETNYELQEEVNKFYQTPEGKLRSAVWHRYSIHVDDNGVVRSIEDIADRTWKIVKSYV